MASFFIKKQPVQPAKKKRSAKTPAAQEAGKTKVLIIAHNHPEFYPGGGEKFAYQLFQQMQESQSFKATFMGATGSISRKPHTGTPFLAFDGRENEFLFWSDKFDYFLQSNLEPQLLYRDFATFLTQQKPDVVHFHHTLRFGVEAIKVVREVLPEATILYTLHDFIPICHRDGQMIKKYDNSLCSKAGAANCNQCFPEIAPARFKTRELFIKTHLKLVDLFIAPSEFLANRFVEWGMPKAKIKVIENGTEESQKAPVRPLMRSGKRDRFAFFGQVSPYKGTKLLLDAASHLIESGNKDFGIDIHGNISLQSEEFKRSFTDEVKGFGNVQFHGRYVPEELPNLIANADWVVVPSIWWENSPLVIAEAFYHRRPVICSNIGGMAEKVHDNVNGLHFKVGNSQSLAEVMNYAMNKNGLWEQLVAGIKQPNTIKQSAIEHGAAYNILMAEKASATGREAA